MGDQATSSGSQNPLAPQYPISSVDNALRLMLMFRDHYELRLSEAAEHLGVANSTAHRLLAMLQYHGFVRQHPHSRAYQAGPALVEVGLSVVRGMDIRGLAHPLLEEISSLTGETSHLAVLEGTHVRYLDAVESTKALRVVSRTGMALPAHCTSVGKVMLAELSLPEVRALYPEARLAPATSRSMRSRGSLERELATVRERRYAINREESEDGVCSVAVVVRHALPGRIAAISCAAPTSRMTDRLIGRYARILAQKSEELAQVLR